MKLYAALTQRSQFEYWREQELPEINFWRQATTRFRALELHDPFLFISRMEKGAPRQVMGMAFFHQFAVLPAMEAWQVFEEKNGAPSRDDFLRQVQTAREKAAKPVIADPSIGCIALVNTVFFNDSDFLAAPSDMSPRMVAGKQYDLEDEGIGEELWEEVRSKAAIYDAGRPEETQLFAAEPDDVYQTAYKARVRIGQASFRLSLIDAYGGRCAITGDTTLPVLEAAHIRDHAKDGPLVVANGILMRTDFHRLFDRGYLTIDENHCLRFSRDFRTRFPDASNYLRFDGRPLARPRDPVHQPRPHFTAWHRQYVFRG